MLYWGGESIGEGDCESSGGVGGDDVYKSKAKPVLVLVSDSYSEDDSISVHDSRPSSSPAYTITDYLCLLATALRKLYVILV